MSMMNKMMNLINRRKQSTQRVDDLANGVARAALDRRLGQMLALHASQPLPQLRHFKPLTHPVATPPTI